MIGLKVARDADTLRFASDTIRARGNLYEGRLQSPSVDSAHVDRWFPTSARLSQSTFRLKDADGEMAGLVQDGSIAGRTAEVVWINEDSDVPLVSGQIRNLAISRGFVQFEVQDPALIRFASALTPILGDIEPTVDENIAGNLVVQVYGRATRLPVSGGLVRGGNIELIASLGHREVTAVRYEGTLLDQADWESECSCGEDPEYTIIRVSGDNDRDVSKFEWSGGERAADGYTIGGMIQNVLTTNGVTASEIDADSFNAFDQQLAARGLMSSGDTPEGAIVVSDRDETISSILQRVQNSWGVLVYLSPGRKFRVGIPVLNPNVTPIDIPSEQIVYGEWKVKSPESASEWEVESDRAWSLGAFTVQRTLRSEENFDAFGVDLEGRTIQQWYARGHSALNFAGDRILFEQWDRFRATVTVDPSVLVTVGDFVTITPRNSTLRIPSGQIWFVDGISIVGSDLNTSRKLALSPILGRGTNALEAITAAKTYSVDAGAELDQDLDELFSQ